MAADTLARGVEAMGHLAGADSLTGAARVALFSEFLEKWHDFFLLTGTAAVTLAGLLFIALSLHMEVLVQERFQGMLLVARSALVSFIVVMIVSITMLQPWLPARPTGLVLMMFAAVFSALMMIEFLRAKTHDHADFSRRTVRRRVLSPLGGFAFIAVSGFGMFNRDFAMTYQVVGGMILLLVNAAYASWDLLVRVARVKSHQAPTS